MFICIYIYIYNILSYSGFYRRHHKKLDSRGLGVWERSRIFLMGKEVVRAYPVGMCI